jgi:DNA mismatch repair protein MutS2
MEFDQTSLRPTYCFRMGFPGSSFAFELAERIGLPQAVLQAARAQQGNDRRKLESFLVDLERKSQELAQHLKEASAEKRRLESLVLSYEQKMLELKRELGTIRKKAVQEARSIVEQAQAQIENSVKAIRESSAAKDAVRSSHKMIRDLHEKLGEMQKEDLAVEPSNEKISVGDQVRLREGQQSGEVVAIDGKQATIHSGNARFRIAVQNLVKVLERSAPPPSHSALTTPVEVKSEIDVRGLLGDEAIAEVQHFLDNAVMAGLHRVDIIHGKGTGALRKRVTEFLKSYPHTQSSRLGEWNEGGAGVTVVELT